MKKALVITICLFALGVSLFAGGSSEGITKTKEPLSFWEHFETFSKMNEALFQEFKAEKGIDIEYTLASPDKMTDAMYVAYRSNQLPDIFTVTFVGGASQMFAENWASPLAVGMDHFSKDIQDQLFEGLTTFKGEVYSVPLFSQNHCALMYYAPSLVKNVPSTYEDFYNECKRIYEESNGTVYGLILPMAFTTRINETFMYMMDAAKAPVINWNTGAYQWDSPQMMELFNLLTRMWDEGLIMPSSVNFNMKEARERWAAGEAAFLIDGIWNVGITKNNFMPELDDFAVCETITPHGDDYMIYSDPAAGVYFIANNSDYKQESTELILGMLSDEYQVKIANVQDQPPFNLDALALADVHQSYIDSVDMFTRRMGVKPYLGLRNLDALQIDANMRKVSPTPSEILNGYFSGAIKDWESALHKYNTQLTAARDEAIKKCLSLGYKVSLDDYVFPNFVYGESYTSEKYSEL